MLIHCNGLIGQNHFNTYDLLPDSLDARSLDIKVDSLMALAKQDSDLTSLTKIAHEHAVYYAKKGDFAKALSYSQIGIRAFEESEVLTDKYVAALYNKGRFHFSSSEYQNAIRSYEKVIKLNLDISLTGKSYAGIGRSYNRIGDYFRGAYNYEKALEMLDSIGEYRSVVTHSINLAVVYSSIGTRESMQMRLQVLEKADSIGIMSNKTRRALVDALANQYSFPFTYNFDKALTYHKENLEKVFVPKKTFSKKDSSNIASIYNNLAHLYNIEKLDSALYYIEKGVAFVSKKETRARLFDTKSDYYLIRGELDQALMYIHRALETILDFNLDPRKVPDAATLSDSNFKDYTILCLKKKTEVLNRLFEQTGKRDYLQQAIMNVKAADALIDFIQSGSYENETKLLWRKTASEVYIKGVYAAQLLGQPEEIFYFIEKNKALLLSEEIVKNTAFANLPGAVSEEIRALKKTILQLENIGFKNTQSTKYQANKNSLFNAKQHYENFTDSVRQIYPAYFKRKVSISPVSLSEWQQSLKANTTFISYIWNTLNDEKEVLIGVAVDRNVAKSFTLTVTDSLKVMIGEYQKLISQPFQTKRDQERSLELSASLFNQLLPNKEVRQMAKRNKLLVVPDGPLQSIPFETLVTDIGSKQLLLQSTDVSYLYSVSFLNYNEGIERKASSRFTGYAPVNFKKTGLNTLQQTRKELDAIEEKIGGRIILEERASKTHFLNESGDYRMIHLATHANASGDPWIAFSDGKMKLYELYTYKNNAELVTLSACNTLLGEIANGEGVLSLSRGFFYSGSKSVVASLWNVNDQATSSIMADFYANLKAGQGKSEALNNSKRNYLKTHSLSEQSPYYWSSFVLLGDDQPIDFSSNDYHWYLIGILMIILLVFLFMKKTKKIG